MIKDYLEAKTILIKKLKKVGVKLTNDNLDGDHFYIKMSGIGMVRWTYETVKISISTPYHTGYKHKNLHIRNFDIIKGDYKKLKDKIDVVIERDKEIIRESKERTKEGNKIFKDTLSMFKKYNPEILEGYMDNSFEIKINKLTVAINPVRNGIDIRFYGSNTDLVKLLDKIKEK